MKRLLPYVAIASLVVATACGSQKNDVQLTKSGLNPENFKAEYQGQPTALYTLVNSEGAEACITNFGGRLVSLMVPDKDGNLRDVVLGFDSVQSYFPENNLTDFGASIGRYANRINQGKFVIDGDTIQLPQNNFGHSLHGGGEMGSLGWQYRVYKANQPNDSTLVLTLVSPDGDNNFPGEVTAQVTYTLKNDNVLDIQYTGTTNKPTILNMTNHSYFNLGGNPAQPITGNLIMVNADGYTPVDSTYMTTGEIATVEGTPFDFRTQKTLGENIKNFDNQQIKNGNGYDHNFVLNTKGDINVPAVELYSLESGILLTMYTTEPGVQVYTGNFLDGTLTGKNGTVYNQHAGVCLESQHYPDSPNKPEWPSTRLNPGETYSTHTIYKFTTK
ncbi:MAG: galactose mutarotase [Muribaculaceae bacterium]|nr:galactose mutarotase [Muribaculaceae bacterium]